MIKFLTEFCRYHEVTLIVINFVIWMIGLAVVLHWLIVEPWRWYWRWLWKGMNEKSRYEIITITFTTRRW